VEGRCTVDIPSPVFTITSRQHGPERTMLNIKLTDGCRVNDMLLALLPVASVTKMEEVIPSMNDIFIEAVNNVKTK
jgi:ABC-2 type transport system ATP-binding protein